MGDLSIAVLGSLVVTRQGVTITDFKYTKVRALLAYLAVEGDRPHTRASLAGLLWPEVPERDARQSLSQALSTLRRAVGEPGDAAAPPLLATTSETVRLNPAQVASVDVSRFLARLDEVDRHPHPSRRTCATCAAGLLEAVSFYRGDLLDQLELPGCEAFQEWLQRQREHLRQRALAALESLTQRAEWCGDRPGALATARRQLAVEPLLESGHRTLMRLLALEGQPATALAQFDHLRRALDQELGVEPEPETLALRDRIRTGDLTGLPDWRAPSVTLPVPPGPLIGRDDDLHQASAHLAATPGRVLTLTGPPGVGKTRLALALAAAHRLDFEHGVCLVALAALDSAELVPVALAQALGVKERQGEPLLTTLAAHLRARHLLLLLDNCEHLPAMASVIAELVAACPLLWVLATSRAALAIRAEQQLPLAPLALPTAAAWEAIGQSPAVQLLVARAQAVWPAFMLQPTNATALAGICDRLDGLPLAIELVAHRLALAAPEMVLAELEQHRIGTPGPRDLPARQRTLREAIAWSVDRLGEAEQRLFAHLGVFSGGGALAAVRAVVDDWPPAATGGVVDDGPAAAAAQPDRLASTLEALQQQSLIQIEIGADESRVTLLETLRAFALERLVARGAAEAARRRHADYYLALAEQAGLALVGPDQARWFARLERELPNLRAALRWWLSSADARALQLAVVLENFWTRGALSEGRRWLATALAADTTAPPLLQARALRVAGALASRQGHRAEAESLLRQGRALYAAHDDRTSLGAVDYELGRAAEERSDFPAALTLFRAALAGAEASGDQRTVMLALHGLAEVLLNQGDYTTARRYQERVVQLSQALGDRRNLAGQQMNLGRIDFDLGDLVSARRHFETSLAVFREVDDRRGIAIALLNLANVLRAQMDLPAARRCFEQSVLISRELNLTANRATALSGLGDVLRRLGELALARASLVEALRLRQAEDDRRGVTISLSHLAAIDQAEQRPRRAACLLGAATALRAALGLPEEIPVRQAERRQRLADLEAVLGVTSFTAAWQAGQALTLDAAVALVLEEGAGWSAGAGIDAAATPLDGAPR